MVITHTGQFPGPRGPSRQKGRASEPDSGHPFYKDAFKTLCAHSSIFFNAFFFNVDHLKNLYSVCYHIVSVLCVVFLAKRHVGSYLLDQESNPHPLHWKVRS